MPITAFRKTRPRDDEVIALQDAVDRVFLDIRNRKIIDGILIADVDLVSGSGTKVNHGLEREPRGYIVVRADADANVWETADPTTQQLTLEASATVTVSLWVF